MGLFGGKKQSKRDKRPNQRTKTATQAQADELRVRARRRLLGAVVLVLVAVLVVPLLFEDTDSTDYAQPPQVVALDTPARPDPDLTVELSEPEDDEPDLFADNTVAGSVLESDAAVLPQPPGLDDVDADADTATDADTRSDEQPAAEPAPESTTTETSPPETTEPADERTDDGSLALALLEGRDPSQSSPDSASPAAASGQYIVQIAAYGARADADKRRTRLAEAGVTNAYVEEASTGNQSAWRLRVGPFSTRDAAQAAQTRLRTLGYDNSLLLTQ